MSKWIELRMRMVTRVESGYRMNEPILYMSLALERGRFSLVKNVGKEFYQCSAMGNSKLFDQRFLNAKILFNQSKNLFFMLFRKRSYQNITRYLLFYTNAYRSEIFYENVQVPCL